MNPYAVLGVEKSATPEQIRSAFRRKVQECHPDHVGGSAEALRDVMAAYEALCDTHSPATGFLVLADGRKVKASRIGPQRGMEIARAKREILREQASLGIICATVATWAKDDPRPALMRKPHEARIAEMEALISELERP